MTTMSRCFRSKSRPWNLKYEDPKYENGRVLPLAARKPKLVFPGILSTKVVSRKTAVPIKEMRNTQQIINRIHEHIEITRKLTIRSKR